MSYIAYLSSNLGYLLVEAPYNARWLTAVRTLIPSNARKVGKSGIYRFSMEYYQPVVQLCDFYFVQVVDLCKMGDRLPAPPADWEEAWARYQQVEPLKRTKSPEESSTDHHTLYVTQDAPQEVIQAAYRALAKLHHPDIGGNADVFKRINAAYRALGGK